MGHNRPGSTIGALVSGSVSVTCSSGSWDASHHVAKRNRKNPSLLFYFNDWEAEPGLKYCSLAAEAMWLRMIAIASRSPEYGVVLIGKGDMTRHELPALLAGTCRSTVEECTRMLDELIRFEVAEVDNQGHVYCRKMVRQAAISKVRADAGKLGATVANNKRQKSGKDDSKARSNDGGKTKTAKDDLTGGQQREIAAGDENLSRQTAVNGDGNGAGSSSFLPFSLSSDGENLTETSSAPDGARDAQQTGSISDERRAYDAWNEAAARVRRWPPARDFTPERRKALAARMETHGGLPGFLAVLVTAEASKFLREGMKGFALDWLLKPANFVKVKDDNYGDARQGVATTTPPVGRMATMGRVIERFKRVETGNG